MRIAQIAPLAESVPPRTYGGTERVVAWLVDELVEQGHDVTLFASGDSCTPAELVPCADTALREAGVTDWIPHLRAMLGKVRERADEFDVLHFHVDLLHFPLFREMSDRVVTTLHGRLDMPENFAAYSAFSEMPLVSISDAQRLPMPPVNWAGTIYHGLPLAAYPYAATTGGRYLVFLGRIAPEKRPDRAIEIAKRAGLPLKIAAKVDPVDRAYFEREIRPLLDHPLIEFIGEVNDREKIALLREAIALLMPIDWPEPFGLVMVEAMSAGTPVVAWRHGSVPEIVDEDVTGYAVDSIDGAVDAVGKARRLSRAGVRARFVERFSASRMASEYSELYHRLRSGEAIGAPGLVAGTRASALTPELGRTPPIDQAMPAPPPGE